MRQNRDHLVHHELEYMPIRVRLHVPLKNVEHLRRVAEVLRGLAYELDNLGRYRDDKPTITLGEAWSAVRRADRRMKEIRGRGRPPAEPNMR
jgi:hypothetical protein